MFAGMGLELVGGRWPGKLSGTQHLYQCTMLVGWGLGVGDDSSAGCTRKVFRGDGTLCDMLLSSITLAHARSFPECHTLTHTKLTATHLCTHPIRRTLVRVLTGHTSYFRGHKQNGLVLLLLHPAAPCYSVSLCFWV